MRLKDIAAVCSVSVSTVSRVLRDPQTPYASEAKRRRILEAAQQMGYQPNASAQALRKSGETQAEPYRFVMVLGRSRHQESNDFFDMLQASCAAQLLAGGLAITPPMLLEEALATKSALAKVDGILLLGHCTEKRQEQLARRAALVGVGLNTFAPQYDQVLCPGYKAARTAMAHLLGKGYAHIGYVGEQYSENRYLAYGDTMRETQDKSGKVYYTVQTVEGGRQAAGQYLADPARPEALFCANDSTAIGFIQGLREAGLPVPPLISIDDIPAAQQIRPRLTTVHIPADEMGAMAVKLLLDRKRSGHRAAVQVTFPFRLVKRESS